MVGLLKCRGWKKFSRMSQSYNFKKIQPVPSSNEFIDIILSKTQRKTPTVVHKGYQISRIRAFYMRKVKFTQESFDEKMNTLLTDFPKLEDIHPFYADLMNVLYDKDHYKLALGQLNTAKHLIDNVGKEYLRMLKFGDSLYRCKQLKRAALGRMATIMKRQKDNLAYLEQVRQHLARLPSIDPNTRTLLVCGYPNVGKSSFMNKMTRAEVEVQPYAFTTKSLFVGHMDYKYLRWQVIDTPGILDHPLEERNTIEMQSITALAHLRACVLYFIDLSEACGYSIIQQVSLFNSIKPLFANKPVLLVVNKIDLVKPEDLNEADRAVLQTVLDQGIEMVTSSCLTEDGVWNVRNTACEKLLAMRIENKLKGQKINDVLNKLHLTCPTPRDDKVRPACIPETVKQRLQSAMEAELVVEKDLEKENGGPGVYVVDHRKNYILADDEWKYDDIPEIMEGKNIADYIDPEIEEKLQKLEEEEAKLEADGAYATEEDCADLEDEETKKTANLIREKKKLIIQAHRMSKGRNKPPVPTKMIKMRLSRKANEEKNSNGKRARSNDMEIDESHTKRARSQSLADVARSRSRARDRSVFGMREDGIKKASALKKTAQKAPTDFARRGEADRAITASKPKHLFTGKRGIGSTDRR